METKPSEDMTLIKSGIAHPRDESQLKIWDLCRSDVGVYTICAAGVHRTCPPAYGRTIHLQALVRSSKLTRQQIADRLGVPKRTLDAWMQPVDSSEHRNPSEVVLRLATITLLNWIGGTSHELDKRKS